MALSAQVKLLPTPTEHGNNNRAGSSPKAGDGLATRVKRLLPTPASNKTTNNSVNAEDLVNADGTAWTPGRKPFDRRTGRQVTTNLADTIRAESALPLYTPTSESSTGDGSPGSGCLPGDFLASHSAMPGNGAARRMTAISGRNCIASLARQGRATSFLRMLLASSRFSSRIVFLKWKLKRLSFFSQMTVTKSTKLYSESTAGLSASSLVSLKKSDTTFPGLPTARQSFCVCQLAVLTPRTEGTGCGLLPTPNASEAEHPGREHSHPGSQVNLVSVVKGLMATPNTMDSLPKKSAAALEREMTVARPGRSKPANLRDQVGNAGSMAETLSVADEFNGRRGTGRKPATIVKNLLPTPSAEDNRDRGNLSQPCIQRRQKMGKQLGLSMVADLNSRSLHAGWVCWMMGYEPDWLDLPDIASGRTSRPSRASSRAKRTASKSSRASATPSSRKSSRKSSPRSSSRKKRIGLKKDSKRLDNAKYKGFNGVAK